MSPQVTRSPASRQIGWRVTGKTRRSSVALPHLVSDTQDKFEARARMESRGGVLNTNIAAAGSAALIASCAPCVAALSAYASSTSANSDPSASCTPQAAASAVFSDWHLDHYTDWQTSQTVPADPDGKAGEANPLNLIQLGAEDTREVTDVPAHVGYVKWTYNPGKDGETTTPTFDPTDTLWQATADTNKPAEVTAGEVHQSDTGNGSWFYWQPVDIPAQIHTEYRWSVYTRTYTPGQPAVDCPNPSGNPTGNPTGNPSGPSGNPSGHPSLTSTTGPSAPAAPVPTGIHAGL